MRLSNTFEYFKSLWRFGGGGGGHGRLQLGPVDDEVSVDGWGGDAPKL